MDPIGRGMLRRLKSNQYSFILARKSWDTSDARFVADDRVNPAARTDSSLTLSTVVFIGPLQNLIWPEVGTAIDALRTS